MHGLNTGGLRPPSSIGLISGPHGNCAQGKLQPPDPQTASWEAVPFKFHSFIAWARGGACVYLTSVRTTLIRCWEILGIISIDSNRCDQMWGGFNLSSTWVICIPFGRPSCCPIVDTMLGATSAHSLFKICWPEAQVRKEFVRQNECMLPE